MNYLYLRVSTDKQTFSQQRNAIDEFLHAKGLKADAVYTDEGVSGGVSYKERQLNTIVQQLKEGDALIVSEISRLGRSMSDLNKLICDELKPRKARLIIISMGIDLDCSNLKAIDEMVLFAFSFSAQVEREMLKERTSNAMDAIKKDIAENGFHVSKKGKKITRLGTPKTISRTAIDAAAEKKAEEARKNPANIFFKKYVDAYCARTHGVINYKKLAKELNALDQKTPTGMPYTEQRARAMYSKIKKLFTE